MKNITKWLRLVRFPFFSVGIAPFILGTVMAWRIEGIFNSGVFILGIFAVILIMGSANLNGEFSDIAEDRLALGKHHSNFAGGSRVIFEKEVSLKQIKLVSFIFIIIAFLIGIFLHFYLHVGKYTLIFGIIGILCGYFYSRLPFRWVRRGVGELIIGFCYGLLPIAASYYIQAAKLAPVIYWVSLPVALSVFNVIFINEYHDYEVDEETGKRNLLVRLGLEKGAFLYSFISVLSIFAFYWSLYHNAPRLCGYLFIPAALISLFLCLFMVRARYKESNILEVTCGLTILVNLFTTTSYIIGFWRSV